WIGSNMSGYHSLAVGFNVLNNLLLNRFIDPTCSITTYNHPMPVTSKQDLVSQQISGWFSSMFLMIAFVFIPVGSIYQIVYDNVKQTKHQQLVSGISFIAYWCGNFVADIIVALPACFLVWMCIYIFDVD